MNNLEKYDAICNELQSKIISDELSYEEACSIEDKAYGKYVTEAYIGKPELMRQAESVMNKLISLMRANPLDDYTNHPLNQKLCSLISKQFGFKETIIQWMRTPKASPNVATICSCDVITRGSTFIENKKKYGYYDKSHTHVCYIMASSTMVASLNISGEEYLAVLLHEIGHNFDHSIFMTVNVIAAIIKSFTPQVKKIMSQDPDVRATANFTQPVIQTVTMTNPGKEVLGAYQSFYEKILAKLPFLKVIGHGIADIGDWIMKVFEYGSSAAMLMATPVFLLLSPVFQASTSFTRKGEEFADSFAAMYGYTEPLITALNKLDRTNISTSTNPLIRIMTDMTMTNRYLIQVAMGDHGTTLDRLNSNIAYLKREIASSNFPPSVKKEMTLQIKEMENFRTTMLMGSVNGDNLEITSFARSIVNRVFNGRSDFIAKLFGTNYVSESEEDIHSNKMNRKIVFMKACCNGEITEDFQDAMLDAIDDDIEF